MDNNNKKIEKPLHLQKIKYIQISDKNNENKSNIDLFYKPFSLLNKTIIND